MHEFARTVLAHFKVPGTFNFVGTLPKTATGKIQKYVPRGGRPGMAHQ
jgi:fatty-acyl-CoA synthase